MSDGLNNLSDRRTFLSQTRSKNEFDEPIVIMDRSTFTHQDNKKMRDEYVMRFLSSKIEDEHKSSFGLYFLDDEERVRYFNR